MDDKTAEALNIVGYLLSALGLAVVHAKAGNGDKFDEQMVKFASGMDDLNEIMDERGGPRGI